MPRLERRGIDGAARAAERYLRHFAKCLSDDPVTTCRYPRAETERLLES